MRLLHSFHRLRWIPTSHAIGTTGKTSKNMTARGLLDWWKHGKSFRKSRTGRFPARPLPTTKPTNSCVSVFYIATQDSYSLTCFLSLYQLWDVWGRRGTFLWRAHEKWDQNSTFHIKINPNAWFCETEHNGKGKWSRAVNWTCLYFHPLQPTIGVKS